jgi:type I restriction enzyme, S subunit
MSRPWPKVPLKYLVSKIGSGKTPKGGAEVYTASGVMLLRSQNVHFDGLRLDDVVHIDADMDEDMSSTRVRPHDVLLNITGASIGRCNVVPAEFEAANVNQHVCIIRPNTDRLLPAFLNLVLQSPTIQNEIRFGENGSSREGLNFEQVGAFEIPLPLMQQQLACVQRAQASVERVQALIREKQGLVDLLAEKRRALIAHAVTRGLNPDVPMRESGVEWLGAIPAHWQIERARWLFGESCLPIAPDDQMVTCFRDGTVTLRSNRREDGFTNGVIEHGYQGIRKGQLVLHSMDAFAGAIGVSDSDGKCTPEYVICDPLTQRTDAHYFAALLREMALRRYVQAFCSAVRERAPRIRFNDFRDFVLPVPPLSEQRAIVDYIGQQTGPVKRLADQTATTLELLKERRTALIAAAIQCPKEIVCAT